MHHIDPRQKSFELDITSLTKRSQESLLTEIGKCAVLCRPCHTFIHQRWQYKHTFEPVKAERIFDYLQLLQQWDSIPVDREERAQ